MKHTLEMYVWQLINIIMQITTTYFLETGVFLSTVIQNRFQV